MPKKAAKPIPFEQNADKLERLVAELEQEALPLERALAAYKEAADAAVACAAQLRAAEERVTVIRKTLDGAFDFTGFGDDPQDEPEDDAFA